MELEGQIASAQHNVSTSGARGVVRVRGYDGMSGVSRSGLGRILRREGGREGGVEEGGREEGRDGGREGGKEGGRKGGGRREKGRGEKLQGHAWY